MAGTKKLDRPAIIYELGRHMRPDLYREIFDWNTVHLRSLLAHYKGKKIGKIKR